MSKIPPVAHDDTQGTWQVVISFRFNEPLVRDVIFQRELDAMLDNWFAGVADLDITVREIGAAGERSEVEGHYQRLDAIEVAETHGVENVNAKGNRL